MTKRVFCIGNGESRIGYDLHNLWPHGKIYGCNAIFRDFLPDALIAVDHGIMHEIYNMGLAQQIPCYFRDWTKVPAMTYENMVLGGIDRLEVEEHLKDVIVTNERGNSKEYVMHGSNIQGLINIIKKDPNKYREDRKILEKKNINHSTIKVSWIKQPDYSHSLTDIMKPRDHGWAAGASAGYVAIAIEKPDEVYMIGHDINSTNNNVNNIYKSTKHYVAKENAPTPGINWINQWQTLMEWNPGVKFYKVNRFNDGRDKVNGPITEWKNLSNLEYIDYSTLDNLA